HVVIPKVADEGSGGVAVRTFTAYDADGNFQTWDVDAVLPPRGGYLGVVSDGAPILRIEIFNAHTGSFVSSTTFVVPLDIRGTPAPPGLWLALSGVVPLAMVSWSRWRRWRRSRGRRCYSA